MKKPRKYTKISVESQEVAKLLSKLHLRRRDKQVLDDITCGLHSGIPECCVAFYVMMWGPVVEAKEALVHPVADEIYRQSRLIDHEKPVSNLLKFTDRYRKLLGPCGYVRCPACILARRVVTVKACDCTK